MVVRLAPAKEFACSYYVRVMQFFLFRDFLAIWVNNISSYIEDDISSLSSPNNGKGPASLLRICSEILSLLVVGEVYILKQLSKMPSFLCLFVFSKKIKLI